MGAILLERPRRPILANTGLRQRPKSQGDARYRQCWPAHREPRRATRRIAVAAGAQSSLKAQLTGFAPSALSSTCGAMPTR
ncbi:hypothetical protein PMO31116_03155 [Pandoraea morbifera]|uniref:Uncharacterized protein n=1 Tax=Pandoraea morbifera TaxID=2508300 RepID=A0A5E4WAI9_9BURK|nr:hypothetical protein PMO31116_03155 [Pandoraea morbifera]